MDNKIGFKKIEHKVHHEHEHNHDVCNHDESCSCHHHHSSKKGNVILTIRLVVSLILLICAYFLNDVVQIIILSVAYLIIAYDILLNAFKNIIKGEIFDENFLMSLASLTALITYFINPNSGIDGFDGVLVIILYQIGEFFQHYASDKTKKSITNMFDLNVDKVTRVNSHIPEIIDVYDIKVNDILVIKPGEVVPTDGIIIEGSSSFNTSSLTGESKPLDASIDDVVLSGFINIDGVIKIKAKTSYKESTSSKVKEMINESSKNKATGERFITKFAKIYTPIVIFISLFIMFVIPLILGFEAHFNEYLYKGLSIMVISCPCALVISIPLSYFVGIGKSAKSGILVKGGSFIEKLTQINSIAFDKTGTLTKGEFEVAKIESDDLELMNNLLFSFEKNVTHPIGKSICNYLKDKASELEIEDFKNVPGFGVSGLYLNKKVLIGNEKLLKENCIEFKAVTESGTITYVCYDNKYLGYALIKDVIKEDARTAIEELNKNYDLHLISGDNALVVEETANELNISSYYYEKLPEEKLNILKDIKAKQKVAYVGDGINDASCLLTSDVGIAMKSLGSDIVMESSDVVILDNNISSIIKSIKISKKTMNVVKMNIFASIFIKVLVMVLAMIITLPMFVAIIADVGVCLLAILNTLTINFKKY